MKFSTQREEFLKPLQVVSGVVERRQTQPILSNVLIELDKEGIRVVATDLEMEVIAYCPVDQTVPGSITVPMRKLQDTCKALPDGSQINFEVKDSKAVIKSGKARFSLTTLPKEDFPVISTKAPLYEFTVEQSVLKQLIDKTSFAMAVQDVRFYLNGLLLEVDSGSLCAVATDGHRLALSKTEIPQIGDIARLQAIIPRKAVTEIGRLLEGDGANVKVTIGENFLRLDMNSVVFTTKLVDAKYPNYQAVIPKGGDKVIVGNKETVRQCLLRTSVLSNEKYRGIRLEVESDVLKASANNPEHEEAEDEVAVEYKGERLTIGFNVSYLLDAISAVSGDIVQIELTDANGSAVIYGASDSESRYVVMPMRL